MTELDWIKLYKQFEKPTNKMKFYAGNGAKSLDTKIGGVPWWPANVERPKCKQGHYMSFISQINLKDWPDNQNRVGVVSFHYCIQCQHDGDMAFGWYYDQNKNYDIRVFSDISVAPDELGAMGLNVPEQTPAFEAIIEIPDVNDLPQEIASILPDEFFEFIPPDYDEFSIIQSDYVWHNLKHVHGSKVGGYPTWVQDSEWPLGANGQNMKFLTQLDSIVGEIASWANGTAFLFIDEDENGNLVAEMGLQHS